jgi:hypothetical protein
MLEHYFGCWNSNSNLNSKCLKTLCQNAKPILPNPYPFSPFRPNSLASPRLQPSSRAAHLAPRPSAAPQARLAFWPKTPPARAPSPEPLTGGTRMSSLPPRRARPGLARVRREHASPCVARTARSPRPGYLSRRRLPGRPTRTPEPPPLEPHAPKTLTRVAALDPRRRHRCTAVKHIRSCARR